MSLQELIVAAIVFFCVFYVGNRITLFFKNTGRGNNPCSSCASGCKLRDELEHKKKSCREQRK